MNINIPTWIGQATSISGRAISRELRKADQISKRVNSTEEVDKRIELDVQLGLEKNIEANIKLAEKILAKREANKEGLDILDSVLNPKPEPSSDAAKEGSE